MPSNSNFEKADKPAPHEGYRLDGKARKAKTSTSEDKNQNSSAQISSNAVKNETKGMPFYDYKFGLLRFNRNFTPDEEEMVKKINLNLYYRFENLRF